MQRTARTPAGVKTVPDRGLTSARALQPLAQLRQKSPKASIVRGSLKKIDAPIVSKTKPPVRPELTPLYEAVLAANTAMSTPLSNSNMRVAITAAVIGVVIKEAQRVIDNARRDEPSDDRRAAAHSSKSSAS